MEVINNMVKKRKISAAEKYRRKLKSDIELARAKKEIGGYYKEAKLKRIEKREKGLAKRKVRIEAGEGAYVEAEDIRGKKKQRKFARQLEEAKKKELPSQRFKESITKGTKKLLRPTEGRKLIKRREVALKGFLGALGVIPSSRYSGAGRPRGTYKHGIPIHEYKRKLAARKASYQEYKDKQQLDLQRRGLTTEQIQQLQMARSYDELEQPEQYPSQTRQYPQQVRQYPQQIQQRAEEIRIIRQRPSQRPRVERQETISKEKGYPQHSFESQDDELRFQDWRAQNTVSPNTQRLLNDIRRIQNKGKSDNIAQQRRHWERRLVGANTNLMKAHENMINVRMDMTGVNPEENILMAPSVFKESPENNILRTNRFNIMQTREAGNNLKFF